MVETENKIITEMEMLRGMLAVAVAENVKLLTADLVMEVKVAADMVVALIKIQLLVQPILAAAAAVAAKIIQPTKAQVAVQV
jgi:hypothetical protein